MSQHSVANAKNHFSELIERAEKGEEIVITRHGKPVVKLSGLAQKPAPKRMTQADIDWLRKHRVDKKTPKEDSVTLIRRMRDEEWP